MLNKDEVIRLYGKQLEPISKVMTPSKLRQGKILDALFDGARLTVAEISKLTKISKTTSYTDIRALVDSRKIHYRRIPNSGCKNRIMTNEYYIKKSDGAEVLV